MRLLFVGAALLAGACSESAAQPGVCTVADRRECVCDDGGLGWETCFLSSPAVWGPCTCNMQPLADAGSNRTVSYKATVTLDATSSLDDDGPDRIYEWTILSTPAGSSATLDDVSSERPSFFADLPGEYRVSLTVGDGFKTSSPASTTITAVNNQPVAVVAPGRRLYTGTSFTLDGSSSYDVNSDSLTYQWTVTSAPAGSVAVPALPTAATTQFVPDVHGEYKLALIVHDGRTSSDPATVTLDVYFPFIDIPFHVRDAAYSAALDRVVLVGISPNALYLFNPATGVSTSVPLLQEPFAVSLAPDGLSAVVGHLNLVSVVNLQTAAVTLTKVMSAGTFDIVHGGNGHAYVFPTAGTSNSIQNVPLSASAVTVEALAPITRAEKVPGALALYGAATAYDAIIRYDIVSDSVASTRAVASPTCDELWIADDAQRIFTRCATVYSISNSEPQDMQLQGSIPGVAFVQQMAQSSSANKLLIIPGDDRERLRFHTYSTRAFESERTLPRFLINDTGTAGYGAYVFLRSGNQSYVVIENASGGQGIKWGMGMFTF